MAGLTPSVPATGRRGVSRNWMWTASAAASLLLAFVVYRVVDAPPDTPHAMAVANLETASMAEPASGAARADQAFGAAEQADAVALVPLPNETETVELSELFLDGDIPEPGELIARLVEQDGELQLVQYTVVDVARAFDEVQVLLRQQHIKSMTAEAAEVTIADAKDRLVGIFVEASESQLAEVIHSLSGDEDFVVDVSTYAEAQSANSFGSAPLYRAAPPEDRQQPSSVATQPKAAAESSDAESAPSGVAIASPVPVEDVESLKQGSRARAAPQAQTRNVQSQEARRRVLIVLHSDSESR